MASGQEELSIAIPPEIITDILYRLPAKSIGRFRCVSKSWLSQLTHPNFIKVHLSIPSRQNHLIFTTPDISRSIIEGTLFLHSHPLHSRGLVTDLTKFDLQLPYNRYDFEGLYIYGSCNGLVLVRVVYEFAVTTVVINPTTRECLQLPGDSCSFDDDYTDNNESVRVVTLYGFGYDSVTDDYKVVSLTYYYSADDRVSVYVCSLRSKKWRWVTHSRSCYFGRCGVFLNGFIHWMVSNDDDDVTGIAAFSLADECFSEVPFPNFCNFTHRLKREDSQLLVLGGKLAIFIKSEGEIWLMNEYGVRESWTKILLHGINKVPISKPKHYTQPSVFDDNGKILVANNDRMMAYEVEKAAFTESVCAWNPEMFRIAGYYVESLVSPKLGNGDEDKSEEDGNEEDESEKDDDAEDDDAEDESEEDDDAEDESEEDDDAEDENEEDDEDTWEGIRADLEFSSEKNIQLERQTSKRKYTDSSNAPFEGYDSWKAKHRQEKLRADKLEEALNHALSKQQDHGAG